MRTSKRVAGVLFALCMAVAGASVHASILVSNQGSSFISMAPLPDGYGFVDLQPAAEVFAAGSSIIDIGGFGVYGRAEAAGQVKWVIFDNNFLAYESVSQSVSSGGFRWYDSPALSMAVTPGHIYTLGLVATNSFAWGRNSFTVDQLGNDVPPPSITSNGLTIAGFESIVNAPNTSGDSMTPGENFAGSPMLIRDYGTDLYQGSVRVFSAGGALPPVPEPSEWAMLLAGLMVVGFVAKRQRRRIV